MLTWWRNGSAFDSRSKGWGFDSLSRQAQVLLLLPFWGFDSLSRQAQVLLLLPFSTLEAPRTARTDPPSFPCSTGPRRRTAPAAAPPSSFCSSYPSCVRAGFALDVPPILVDHVPLPRVTVGFFKLSQSKAQWFREEGCASGHSPTAPSQDPGCGLSDSHVPRRRLVRADQRPPDPGGV